MGCDYATYNEFDFARREVIAYLPCSAESEDLEMTDTDWNELVAELAIDRDVQRDGIVTTSDHFSRERRSAFEAGPSYHAEFGILDTMCVRIGPPGARVVLNRCDRDFDRRDRLLMHELQPHLFGLWEAGSIRRRLRAALAALDHQDAEGVVFVSDRGDVEFASASARRLLRTHLGGGTAPLPAAIATWRENGHDVPLVIPSSGTRLVVRAADGGSTLLLTEEAAGLALLTPREREVVRCVAAGLSNEEIAQRLWIEVPTVRKHLEHVYGKLGVRSRTAAVAKLRLASGETA
ncbi:MAG TPA: helix-turn-helix transcriptional regulator [Actinomycetota bacterium]|nr:helix-turn-helix transcriptional regulator [Actinomycetota bacterium]